jgi:hypothetical protein
MPLKVELRVAVGLLAACASSGAWASQPDPYTRSHATKWTAGLGISASRPAAGVMAGPSLFVERAFGVWSSLHPVLRLGARHLLRSPSDERPVTSLGTAMLEGCAAHEWRSRWRAAVCLGLDAGVLSARSGAAAPRYTVRSGWVGAAASLRLEWANRDMRLDHHYMPPPGWWERPGVGWEVEIGVAAPARSRIVNEAASAARPTLFERGDPFVFAAVRLAIPFFQPESSD